MDLISDQTVLSFDMEMLYEEAPCGYLSFYPDGTIIKINRTLSKWADLPPDETIYLKKFSDLLGKGGAFYYSLVVLPLLNMQGYANEINFEIKVKNGNTIPCLFNAITTQDNLGKVQIIHATIINITDRKKYESELLSSKQLAEKEKKRFEFFCNFIPDIIWTASESGKIDFLNDRFYQYLGYQKSNAVEDEFRRLFDKKDYSRFSSLLKKSIKKQNEFSLEVRLKNSFNKYQWFLIRGVPYIENNVITLWIGSCTNINEHKERYTLAVNKLTASLQSAALVIEDNIKTLDEIAFDQSHIIRLPLANLLGLIQLFESREMSEDMRSLIPMLSTSASQLDLVIKQIAKKTDNR